MDIANKLFVFSQSFDATENETNSINGIFAFSCRPFNSAHLTWPSSKSNKTLAILVLFLSGDIQTNPGPRHQPVYPCGFCELCHGHPTKKLYAVMNAAYGTIGHVLKCAPKIIACYNAQCLCCRCQTMSISSFTFQSFEISPSFYEPMANEDITLESLSPTFNPLFTGSHKSTDQHVRESNKKIQSFVTLLQQS